MSPAHVLELRLMVPLPRGAGAKAKSLLPREPPETSCLGIVCFTPRRPSSGEGLPPARARARRGPSTAPIDCLCPNLRAGEALRHRADAGRPGLHHSPTPSPMFDVERFVGTQRPDAAGSTARHVPGASCLPPAAARAVSAFKAKHERELSSSVSQPFDRPAVRRVTKDARSTTAIGGIISRLFVSLVPVVHVGPRRGC